MAHMTGRRLAECLELLGWSQRGFADSIGKAEKCVRIAIDGGKPLPEDVTDVLELRARHAAKHPLPPIDPLRAEAARNRRLNGRHRRHAAAATAAPLTE